MGVYRIKERRRDETVYDESNYWQQMRPSQRVHTDLEEYERLNALPDEVEPDQPLPNHNPWRRSRLLWLLALCAALVFVWWSFEEFVAGDRIDFSLLARSNRLAQQESLQDLQQAVVSIECVNAYGPVSGSGFNISPEGLIVTNAHVIDGAQLVTLYFPGGRQRVFTSRSLTLLEGLDLALIDIDGQDLPCVELADYQPESGQPVIFIGSPLGYDWTIAEGEIAGAYDYGGTQVLALKGPVQPGSSGSPVFDRHSRVVGVVFAKFSDREDMGLALPVSYLTSYLDPSP